MTYTSHADLGGQPGHGPVAPEPEGELWHEAFEPKALALTLAMGALSCLYLWAGLHYWLAARHIRSDLDRPLGLEPA